VSPSVQSRERTPLHSPRLRDACTSSGASPVHAGGKPARVTVALQSLLIAAPPRIWERAFEERFGDPGRREYLAPAWARGASAFNRNTPARRQEQIRIAINPSFHDNTAGFSGQSASFVAVSERLGWRSFHSHIFNRRTRGFTHAPATPYASGASGQETKQSVPSVRNMCGIRLAGDFFVLWRCRWRLGLRK